MNKKLYLFGVLIAFSFVAAYTSFNSFAIKNDNPEVKAESSQAVYLPESYRNIGKPVSLVVLSDGSVWYTDHLNYRLVKVNSDGEIVRTVGRYGDGEGEFSIGITGLTVDNQDNLYVQTAHWTYKLDSNGGYIDSWGLDQPEGETYSNATYIHYDSVSNSLYISDGDNHRVVKRSVNGAFISAFGTEGSGDGQFMDPQGVATDASGNVYVVDSEPNCRVEVFSPSGTFIRTFGSCGNGDGQLAVPRGIHVKSNGDILVTSAHGTDGHKIIEFESDGDWIRSWGEHGHSAWQILTPVDVVTDSAGNYYIADYDHQAIQKFSSSRVFVSSVRNSGFTSGKFSFPRAVAYDSEGNLYVLDNGAYEGRIQKFTNAGTYMETIIDPPTFDTEAYFMTIKNDQIYVSDNSGFHKFALDGTQLLHVEASGTGDGQFQGGYGIAVDSTGNVYVGDSRNHRVQKFDSSGNYLTQWGTFGEANGEFGQILAILIDSSDQIYVSSKTEEYNDEIVSKSVIQVFDASGTYIRTIGGEAGDADGSFFDIGGMAFDEDGNLHVSESYHTKIQVFNDSGVFLRKYGAVTGSGTEEYYEPRGLARNPVSGVITVADLANHRVQLVPSGTRIYNLISSADVISTAEEITGEEQFSTSENTSLVSRYYNPASPGIDNLNALLTFGEYLVSDFNVDLTEDRDWSQVNAITLPNASKSLVVNLNPTTAPGISSTHSIYIYKLPGQTSVRVCPNAVTVADISLTCTGGYVLTESSADLEVVTVDGKEYWKVSGLGGTGAMSYGTTTPTATPTTTVTATPTTTVTLTPTTTPTSTVVATPVSTPRVIAAVTLPPVVKGTTPACPIFDTFTVSETLIKKGGEVSISWTTKNTEIVRITGFKEDFSPVDSVIFKPEITKEYSITADNGYCTAVKTVTVMVATELPWRNTIVVGSSMLAIEAVIALQQPTIFGNIWLSLAGFISRKKRQKWGVVYDSRTKKPLPRAVVRLIHINKEVADTVVSDATGSFRLSPKQGVFTISVSLAGYTFPSTVITADNDGGFNNIYKGREIELTNASEGMLFSIPLDSVTLSDQERKRLQAQSMFTKVIEFFSNALLLGGFAYGGYIAYIYPHKYNFIVLGVYVLLLLAKIVQLLPKKSTGSVKTTKGAAVAGLELGLFDPEFNTLLYRTFTSASGEYNFVVPNARYHLKLMDTTKMFASGVPFMEILPEGKERVRVLTLDLTLHE